MNKRIILLSILSLLLPIQVNALTGSVKLNCDTTTLTVNSSTNCNLSGYTSEQISALSAKLNASGNITISNISTASIWQGNGEEGNIDLYTDSNKIGNFDIVSFKINASSNAGTGIINVNNVSFSDASFNEQNISNNSISIIVETVSQPEDEQNSSNSTENQNTTSSSQNPQITPDQIKSNDATLKSLVINSFKINLLNDIFEYTVEVSNDTENIQVSAVASNDKSNVVIPEKLTLKVGLNNFKINVFAEDGTKKVYEVNVHRLDKSLSNNSNLKILEIEGYQLDFKADKYSYNIKDIKFSKMKINAVAEDSAASVKIYGNENISKNDAIIIKVTAEDGSVSEYILYANNISKSKANTSFISILILLIASIVINIIMFVKKKNNKKQLNNNYK